MSAYPPSHLPGCEVHSLAEIFPHEEKPAELSDHAWFEIKFERCADGCPVIGRTIARGVELAKEHGWD